MPPQGPSFCQELASMLLHFVLPTILQSENYRSCFSDVETEAQEPMGLM